MRLALSGEQREFARSVREALEQRFPAERLRDEASAELRREQLLLLGELGLLGALVRESDGGLGLGLPEIVGAVEAVGHAVGDGPWTETLALVPLLAAAGGRATDVAVRAATGETVLAFADRDPLVPFAAEADALLVRRDGSLYLLGEGEWAAAAQPGLDGGAPVATIDAAIGPDTALASDDAVERTLNGGAVVVAALQCGVASRLLASTVDYVKQREQFGVPIGSFQAVKHRLADVLVSVEVARPLVWAAAWWLETGDDAAADHVSAARLCSGRAAADAAAAALQLHGAIGYTLEHPLAVWLKAAWCLEDRWGRTGEHANRLARSLLGR